MRKHYRHITKTKISSKNIVHRKHVPTRYTVTEGWYTFVSPWYGVIGKTSGPQATPETAMQVGIDQYILAHPIMQFYSWDGTAASYLDATTAVRYLTTSRPDETSNASSTWFIYAYYGAYCDNRTLAQHDLNTGLWWCPLYTRQ